MASSALLSLVAIATAVQEETAIGAKEGAETAPGRVGGGEDRFLQQPGEVLLRQVEGVGLAVAQAPDQRIDRVPVRRAQLGERIAGFAPRPGRRRGPRGSIGSSGSRPAGSKGSWEIEIERGEMRKPASS